MSSMSAGNWCAQCLLTEGGDFDLGMHFFIGGIDSAASVIARVFFSQIFDKKHDGCVTRLLLGVDPIYEKQLLSPR